MCAVRLPFRMPTWKVFADTVPGPRERPSACGVVAIVRGGLRCEACRSCVLGSKHLPRCTVHCSLFSVHRRLHPLRWSLGSCCAEPTPPAQPPLSACPLGSSNRNDIIAFFRWALGQEDTWAVTYSQARRRPPAAAPGPTMPSHLLLPHHVPAAACVAHWYAGQCLALASLTASCSGRAVQRLQSGHAGGASRQSGRWRAAHSVLVCITLPAPVHTRPCCSISPGFNLARAR